MSNEFDRIDSRSVRVSAAVAAVLLVAGLALGPVDGLALVAVVTFLLAIGAILGWRVYPPAALFRRFVRPRVGPATDFMSHRAVRFEQALGMLLTLFALLAGVMGAAVLFYVFVGAVAVAAIVEAVFGYCLGCEAFARLLQLVRAPEPAQDNRDEAAVR